MKTKTYKNRRWVLKRNNKYMVSLVDKDTKNLFEATKFSFKHPNIKDYKAVEIKIGEAK